MRLRVYSLAEAPLGTQMEPSTLIETRAAVRAGTEEHRRAARMRKVRPVAFVPRNVEAEPALQTVTANVSRGGMLLVTRQDHFPPAGAAVLLMPFEMSTGAAPDSNAAIQGRIVYTRFSSKAKLRFAGLKFEQDLPERTARMLGLDGAPDSVTDAIATLEELEANAHRAMIPVEAMRRPAPMAMEAVELEPRRAEPVREISDEFAAVQREFIMSTAVFLDNWGEERIRRSLSERHALARAKGAEGLRAMKRDWTELRGRFREMAAAEIDLRGMTAQVPGANPYYNAEQDQPRTEIMQALRKMAGHIGRILIRHGFDDIGPGNDWMLIASERGAVSFAGAMGYSDAMRDALLRAGAVHAEMARAREQSAAAREQEAQAEALRLWDRA